MKLPYTEGSVFAVPLERGGFAIGVVARATRHGRVIFCHFFGPRLTALPPSGLDWQLTPHESVLRLIVGDYGLIHGEWPVIGRLSNWNREEWGMPPFLRTESLRGAKWIVTYSDANPSQELSAIRTEREHPDIPQDGMSGSGAAEWKLDRALPLINGQ